ncbi:hypothetical protein ONZ51_g9745 [Trametes cubensis]|uniref:UBC core domain-containing protein n=1 Tax=Trametes cubensis TaxID=1111947 RepID=A0AAD7X9I5_9APHY|nr:hypothetical protein ONZ51_g9745 [Trametes cubensis]
MTALRRIQKELRDITNNPIEGLSVQPLEDNLFEWKCAIKAAPNSPYKGGTFHFTLTLPENFPFKAPSVTFTTKIYHPGINEEGHICVPILRDQWKPTITLSSGPYASLRAQAYIDIGDETVLSTIQDKLNNPSPDDPFEPDIAALLKNDKARFLATAHEWTKRHGTISGSQYSQHRWSQPGCPLLVPELRQCGTLQTPASFGDDFGKVENPERLDRSDMGSYRPARAARGTVRRSSFDVRDPSPCGNESRRYLTVRMLSSRRRRALASAFGGGYLDALQYISWSQAHLVVPFIPLIISSINLAKLYKWVCDHAAYATLLLTESGTDTSSDDAANASMYSQQASSLLQVVNSEISAAGSSASAYTAYITTISGRPVVEMSESVSGQVWVAMTTGSPIAGVDNAEATPTGGANDTSSANASTDSSSGASSSPTPASSAQAQASSLLNNVQSVISSKTELSAYVTQVAGVPVVEVSSKGGEAITLATSAGGSAFTTTFDGLVMTAVPASKNAAAGSVVVPKPLLTGVVGAMGAVAAGAMMLL